MYNENYLAHYGKIGMRWGHRMRYKDARKQYDGLKDAQFEKNSKSSGLKTLSDKTYDYAKKHNLAFDDGGGGTDKQMRTYEKMSQKLYNLEEEVTKKSRIEAGKQFVEKFGEREYRRMKTVGNLQAAAALTAFLTVPIVTVVGLSVLGDKIRGR